MKIERTRGRLLGARTLSESVGLLQILRHLWGHMRGKVLIPAECKKRPEGYLEGLEPGAKSKDLGDMESGPHRGI